MLAGSPAQASQRKTIKEPDKEATLAPAGLIADDKPQCVERIAPAHPPSRGRETCFILGFMGFLLLLSGSLLTRFKEPAPEKGSRSCASKSGNFDDGQLKRLTRQLAALGLNSTHDRRFARWRRTGNMTDKLYTASCGLTKDGRYGAVLSLSRLVDGVARHAPGAGARLSLTSQRAVVTPGGARCSTRRSRTRVGPRRWLGRALRGPLRRVRLVDAALREAVERGLPTRRWSDNSRWARSTF